MLRCQSKCLHAALHSWTQISELSTEAVEPTKVVSLAASRAVLQIAGPDAVDFLQGILTNDVSSLGEADSRPVYAALLNAQGRFLHDLFLHSRSGSQSPIIFADTDKEGAPALASLLNRYRLRAKVKISDVSSSFSPWVRYLGAIDTSASWPSDPRLTVLGSRTIADPSPHPQPAEDLQDYQHWRFQQGVAEGSELPRGHAVPLEYNLDGLGAISYSKGCYIGQELIARAHYQGVVRKRLMPARVNPQAGSLVVAGASLMQDGSTRSVGRVIAVCRDTVLVLVQLKAALQAAAGQSTLLVAGSNTVLQPWCPSWWPTAWNERAAQLSAARA